MEKAWTLLQGIHLATGIVGMAVSFDIEGR
jgi:hypothetical protein